MSYSEDLLRLSLEAFQELQSFLFIYMNYFHCGFTMSYSEDILRLSLEAFQELQLFLFIYMNYCHYQPKLVSRIFKSELHVLMCLTLFIRSDTNSCE
jgi:hypothetical protein